MSSLFKKPEDPAGITFMLRGDAGTGKTRFALGVKRVTQLPCAYIGTDRGTKFYKDDPEVGGFLAVETRDAKVIDAAIDELADDWGKTFGAAVVDTITDLWSAEQKLFTKKKTKKKTDGTVEETEYIPINSWRPMREGHEAKLRRLQSLPLHTFLICEEKAVYQRNGTGEEAELVEVGSREDADKKDSYVSDVRLRFFILEGRFYAEVLKDRTGTFPMGEVIENPRVEMWIKGKARQTTRPERTAAPAPAVSNGEVASGAAKSANGALPSADAEFKEASMRAAKKLTDRIATIKNVFEFNNWVKKHKKEIEDLVEPFQSQVKEAGKAKRLEFDTTSPAAGSEVTQ